VWIFKGEVFQQQEQPAPAEGAEGQAPAAATPPAEATA
jgi:hypothetical protein